MGKLQRIEIPIKQLEGNKGQIDGVPANPRYIKDTDFKLLQQSIRDMPYLLEARPLIVFPLKAKYIVLCGNQRLEHAKIDKWERIECAILPQDTPVKELRRISLIDNKSYGNNDWDMLFNEWDAEELKVWGMDLPDTMGGGDEENEADNSAYTSKIDIPTYEPKNEKPTFDQLYDKTTFEKLIDEIESSDLDKSEKEFLKLAACRHIVFNYSKIADLYAHASPNMQNLMENSALVIIDFDKAIEKGFVKLGEKIAELYGEDYPNEDYQNE